MVAQTRVPVGAPAGADAVVDASPVTGPAGARTYEVDPAKLPSIAERAAAAGWRYASLVADAPVPSAPLRLDQIWQAPGERVPIVIRTVASGEVPSIARTCPAASWSEREVQDLFGVAFTGSPDARPIVHHEDWPKGLCPLRPGERLEVPVERVPGEFAYRHVEGEGVMEIRVGPIHAGIIEPGHFRFSAIGEMVVGLEARLFYVHRGLEQRAVGMSPAAALILAERVSGTSAVGHSLAAARAIEAALGVEIAPAHDAVRCLLLELERFYNHVADLGNLCAGTAMTGLLAEGLLQKERLWEMNARLTGSRQLRNLVGFGGLRRVPDAEALSAAVGCVREILGKLEAFGDKFFGSASNLERLSGTGILSREHATKLGTVGVVARASGVRTDCRVDLPRAEFEENAYAGLVPATDTGGDVLARAQLRMTEARESARLCEGLAKLAAESGPARAAKPQRNSGEGLGWAEGARGEIVTYVRVENGRLARLRVRSPSRMNWPAITLAMPGNIVPDFPLINKSFNLSYAGCDL